jgi:host factor-I protein
MQSFFEQRGGRLDTTLPSVRHVQELIRSRVVVCAAMVGGEQVEGRIHWQDPDFLALRQEDDQPLILLRREAIAVLRSRR